jgi:hypothetical protein
MSLAVAAFALTSGRLVASVAALLALGGAIVGALALLRPAARGLDTIALAAGVVGLVVGGWVIAVADGGPGSGSGIVGGFAAVALGLTAAVLGGLARARGRRTA